MTDNIKKTETEWRKILTVEQYAVLRQQATERPFTGKYVNTKTAGVYNCAACGQALFSSGTKYESGCGWPSFWDVLENGTVKLLEDNSHGMQRVEVVCSNCNSHLGHVFNDGPRDKTGLRYCINSISLELDAKDEDK